MEHTKWVVNGLSIETSRGRGELDSWVASCDSQGTNESAFDEANARLIAAAPELLEVLKLAMSYTRAVACMDHQVLPMALNVIAKAEGRQ